MLCSRCGYNNLEDAAFCVNCGSAIVKDSAQPQGHVENIQQGGMQTAFQTQPQYYPYANIPPVKRRRKGLVIGLIAVGVLAAAAAVLLILLLPGNQPVIGRWYCEDSFNVLEFHEDGTVESFSSTGTEKKDYKYSGGSGTIEANGQEVEFKVDGDKLELEAESDLTYERADEDFDIIKFVSNSKPAPAITAAPLPEATIEAPVEATAAATQAPAAGDFDILGEWYDITGFGGILRFSGGGTLVFTNIYNMEVYGTYTFDPASGAGTITMQYKGETANADFHIEIYDWDDTINLYVGDYWFSRTYKKQEDWSSLAKHTRFSITDFDFKYNE